MAKKPDNNAVYVVTIGGTYGAYAPNGQEGFVEKPYEMTVRMSNKMINPPPIVVKRTKEEMDYAKLTEGPDPKETKEIPALVAGPLSVFKHHFTAHMKRKHPDFQVWKMHEISKPTTRVDGLPVTDIKVMNRTQLVEYVDENSMPVNTSMYEDVGTLRNAIARCEDDEAAFVRSQNQLGVKAKHGVDMASEVELMNPLTDEDVVEDIVNDAEPEEQPSPQPQPQRSKGGRPPKDKTLAGAGI